MCGVVWFATERGVESARVKPVDVSQVVWVRCLVLCLNGGSRRTDSASSRIRSLSHDTSADPAWRAAEMMHGHSGGLRDTVAMPSSADPWSGWIRARAEATQEFAEHKTGEEESS